MRFKLNIVVFFGMFAVLATALFSQQPAPVLVSPSHPVGIDDIDKITDYYDITFPIPELGNCANFAECLKYCADPVNYNACSEFAKKKDFHQEDPALTNLDKLYQQAKAELGCDSATTCMEYCNQVTNFNACDVFAKKLKLLGGYIDSPDKPKFLTKAKEILGCDSYETCRTFCDDPANAQRCSDFANQVGLLGGQAVIGPGGCTSETNCKSYCSDPASFSECSKYAPAGGFTGPGGCNSPESCRSYCEQNPDNCRSYAPGASGVYVPANCPANHYFGPGGVCTAQELSQQAGQCAAQGKYWNGQSCSDQPPVGVNLGAGGYFQPREEWGNCATPGECYDYCKANPGKCQGFNQDAPRPQDNYLPTLYYTPGTEVKFEPKSEMGNCDSPSSCYDWCRANPGKCEGFDPNAPKPSDTYHPGGYYTPSGIYPTPSYYTPGTGYTSPYSYYTPGGATYATPGYYTPGEGTPYPYYSPTYYTPGSYSYPTPGYYTPGYSYPSPSYGTPTYGTPTYGTPSYGTPSYPTPSYGTPEYPTPSYSTPPGVQGVKTQKNSFQRVLDFIIFWR